MSKTYLSKGTIWVLTGMVFQLLMGYINTILLLRFVPVSIYGTVVFLFSFSGIAAVLSRQGMQVAATKFISEYVSKGDWKGAMSLLNECRWFVMVAAALLCVASPLAYKLLLPQRIASQLNYALFLVFLIPFIFLDPLLRLNQNSLMGLKLTALSSLTGFILQPIFRVLCIVTILALLPTVTGVIYVYIIPLIIAWLFSEILIPQKKFGIRLPSVEHAKLLYRFSLPLIGTEFLTLGIDQADKLFLGYMLTPESVGVYNVASKIAFLVVAPYWAGSQTVGPLFSEYWSKKEIRKLDEIYRFSTYLFLFVVGSIMVFLWINLHWVLGIFGESFLSDETFQVTMILSGSFFLTILPGNFAQLVRMSGKTYISAVNTLLICVLNLVLNYFLILRYGIVGAAIATAIAFTLGHFNGFLILKYFYKSAIWPFSRKYFIVLAVVLGFAIMSRLSINITLNNFLALVVLASIGYLVFKEEITSLFRKQKVVNLLVS